MTGSQVRQGVFFVLAVVGLLWTGYFNVQWLGNDAFDHSVEGFIRGLFANSASSSGGADLAVAAVASYVFMVAEARRTGMRHAWLYVVGSMVTAIAFTFPLFLAMRERRLDATAATI